MAIENKDNISLDEAASLLNVSTDEVMRMIENKDIINAYFEDREWHFSSKEILQVAASKLNLGIE